MRAQAVLIDLFKAPAGPGEDLPDLVHFRGVDEAAQDPQ